jgi:hypothetical protein
MVAVIVIANGALAWMHGSPSKREASSCGQPMELVLRVDALEREFVEMNRRIDEALRTLEVRHQVIRDPIRNGVRL